MASAQQVEGEQLPWRQNNADAHLCFMIFVHHDLVGYITISC